MLGVTRKAKLGPSLLPGFMHKVMHIGLTEFLLLPWTESPSYWPSWLLTCESMSQGCFSSASISDAHSQAGLGHCISCLWLIGDSDKRLPVYLSLRSFCHLSCCFGGYVMVSLGIHFRRATCFWTQDVNHNLLSKSQDYGQTHSRIDSSALTSPTTHVLISWCERLG